jgi:8-amino-7-oxononanoate synthase
MIWDELQSELDALRARRPQTPPPHPRTPLRTAGAGRRAPLISFCSNDYLGLANDPALVEAACAGARAGASAAAPRIWSAATSTPHAVLEQKLAAFTGFARALLFSTGYMANLGIVPALVGRGDAVFADRLNHASLIDAVQLSRADSQRYPHGDLAALERLLAASTARRKLILTDAVFSMDGDLAPCPACWRWPKRFDAWLVVDDAHGFGVLGAQGRGSLAHFKLPGRQRLIYMGTLGKAAGAAGAFVAGSATVIEWLLQRARTYIFTTGQQPDHRLRAAASLDLIADGDARRAPPGSSVAQLRDGLAGTRWRLLPSPTAIQPVIIGDNHEALRVAGAFTTRPVGAGDPPADGAQRAARACASR